MPTLLRNRKAYHDYEILEDFEAGIKLTGQEVKSIKEGRGDITGAYVKPYGDYLSLIGMHLPPYSNAGKMEGYDPKRSRVLLVNLKELKSLQGKVERQGYTLVPLKIYTKGTLLKLAIGLARGKKHSDKRADLIKEQQNREMERLVKKKIV